MTNPPVEMLGTKIVAVKNFERETFRDVEGDEIPKEKMLIFELADKTRIAVRGSEQSRRSSIIFSRNARRTKENSRRAINRN